MHRRQERRSLLPCWLIAVLLTIAGSLAMSTFHPLAAVGYVLFDHWELDEIHRETLTGGVRFSKYNFYSHLNIHDLCKTNFWVARGHMITYIKDSPFTSIRNGECLFCFVLKISMCIIFQHTLCGKVQCTSQKLESLSTECLQRDLRKALLNIIIVMASEQITAEMEKF